MRKRGRKAVLATKKQGIWRRVTEAARRAPGLALATALVSALRQAPRAEVGRRHLQAPTLHLETRTPRPGAHGRGSCKGKAALSPEEDARRAEAGSEPSSSRKQTALRACSAAALPRGKKLGSAVTFAPPPRTRRTAGTRHALGICLPTRPRRETPSRRPRPTGRSHWLRRRRRRRRLSAAGSVFGPCAQPACSVHGQSGPRAEREQPMGGRPSAQGRPFLPSPLPFPLDRKDCAGGATVGFVARRA